MSELSEREQAIFGLIATMEWYFNGKGNSDVPMSGLATHLYNKGYRLVEPVQLEVLGERGIKNALADIQPEGFDWTDLTDTEMIKFKAVSQETNAHNEAKRQLYRRVE